MDRKEAIDYLQYIMKRFSDIGRDEKGGFTRLAYTEEEDMMHWAFSRMGIDEGYIIETDEVGNTFLSIEENEEYYLIGSHLDSVINGGQYDGVIGVAVGLLLLKYIKEEGLKIPLKVVALRCEESTNFRRSTLGSSLITGDYNSNDFKSLVSRDGKRLEDIFKERGYSQEPEVIKGVINYLELHIEQGRVLESEGLELGIVNAIAGNERLKINIKGDAEHSGATPMDLRLDALCAGAEIILAIEKLGQDSAGKSGVATVGELHNYPNSMNVIPGQLELAVDIRSIDSRLTREMRLRTEEFVEKICQRRGLTYEIEILTPTKAVSLDKDLYKKLSSLASDLDIKHKIMPSGAGHDAMKFADITRAGLVFIPCKEGISHNPKEEIDFSHAAIGGKLLIEYLKEELR